METLTAMIANVLIIPFVKVKPTVVTVRTMIKMVIQTVLTQTVYRIQVVVVSSKVTV